MGGAGAAAVNASEGVFLNPAVLAHAPKFESSLSYKDGYLGSKTHSTQYGINLVDNSENIFMPGALSYFQGARTFPSGVRTEDQLWQIAVGKFIARNLAFGLNAYWLKNEIPGRENESHWNGTLGLHYTLSPSFAVAAVYYNPIGGPRDIPVELRMNPEVRLGLQYAPQDFVRLRLDISRPERDNPDKEGVIYTGVEADLRRFAMFRVGAQFDDYNKRNLVTFGAGFNGPRLKINYSLQKPLKGTGGAVHGVDFRVPVW